MQPVTGNTFRVPSYGMGKRLRTGKLGTPGRKADSIPPGRSAFQLEFARRVRSGRERLSRRLGHDVTQREMAQMLSRAAGYEVGADNYRKYENSKKPVMMPHDLLFHFAEITGTTVGTLMAPLSAPARPGDGHSLRT